MKIFSKKYSLKIEKDIKMKKEKHEMDTKMKKRQNLYLARLVEGIRKQHHLKINTRAMEHPLSNPSSKHNLLFFSN